MHKSTLDLSFLFLNDPFKFRPEIFCEHSHFFVVFLKYLSLLILMIAHGASKEVAALDIPSGRAMYTRVNEFGLLSPFDFSRCLLNLRIDKMF